MSVSHCFNNSYTADSRLRSLPLPNNAPAKAAAEGTTDITTIPSPAPSLSSLYLAPSSDKTEATTFYTASKLPPMPVSGVKLSWAPSTEVPPHDEFAYFPMVGVQLE